MLRRTRVLIPAVATFAALLGASVRMPIWVLLLVVTGAGVAVDLAVSRVEEARLRDLADRVVAFAGDVRTPPELEAGGSTEWQRLVAALQEVATALGERMEALQDERERVQRVVDAMPAAVLLFTDGVLAYANPAAQEAFGLPEPPGVLTALRALGVASLAEAVQEVAETGRDLTVTVVRDARELVASCKCIAIGEIALIVTDVTDVRRVEVMRRDFVANASHELKTPVTGMQALADSLDLAMQRDPERAAQMVRRIQAEATRLARLVRDLLDLTRLEEDGAATRHRIDVSAVVAAQVARLEGFAEDAGVALAHHAEPGASMVGVPEDLKLIVGNLVMNAISYNTPGGRVDVHVRRGRGEVLIEVVDTGIGIPQGHQDRIFERFYRVDKARSRAAGGTGLGLSLVRNAVDRHGGDVGVSSVLGEGSTFTVRLPVDGGAAND